MALLRQVRRRLDESAWRDALLGFQDRSLEEAYHADFAAAAKRGDVAAALIFCALTLGTAHELLRTGARGMGSYLCATAVVNLVCRLYVAVWLEGPTKARVRTRLAVVLRVHIILVMAMTDPALEGPNRASPHLGWGDLVRTVLVASRTLTMWLLCLGLGLPLRFHLPVNLFSLAAITGLNSRQCRGCSPAMQDVYLGIARSLTRAVSAGLLLPPPQQAPLPREAACAAVTSLLFIALGTLLPNAFLLYTETKGRMEFLWAQQQRRRQKQRPDKAAVRQQLSKEASLATFPLLVGVLALPLTGLLWNLLLHVHNCT